MGLLDKLTQQGSVLTAYDGATPLNTPGSNPTSKLHYEYSVNGNPFVNGQPNPSTLDLDGKTPSKYLDNPPG
jgi:hypothetical protein